MADKIESGTYEITLNTLGSPRVGVNHTGLAWQPVQVEAPINLWTFKHVGDDKYLLGINEYAHTGAPNNKVIASIHEKGEEVWEITYHEDQHGYTIAPAKKPEHGWTVPHHIMDGLEIEIKPIRRTPQFYPGQLFSIKKRQ